MRAVLPMQNKDDTTAEIFVKVYRHKLGQYPDAALSYLADKAIDRCDWFPTIKECQEILSEWKRTDDVANGRREAIAMVRHEMDARMDDAFREMKAGAIKQAGIGVLSDRWKRIAVERGHLRCIDGAYSLRIDPATQSEGE